MKIEEMEARLIALEEQNQKLQDQVRTLQDIEDIKKVQRCYSYYIEKGMMQEFGDLFADGPDTGFHMIGGQTRGFGGESLLGKEVILKSLANNRVFTTEDHPNPEVLHGLVLSTGIVHVNPDGKTGHGRWYGQGSVALPLGKGITQTFCLFLYENDYIKENGVWKLKVVRCHVLYSFDTKDGFVPLDRIFPDADPDFRPGPIKTTGTALKCFTEYPTGYIVPMHFKHPVTGKETSEKKRDTLLGLPILKF